MARMVRGLVATKGSLYTEGGAVAAGAAAGEAMEGALTAAWMAEGELTAGARVGWAGQRYEFLPV